MFFRGLLRIYGIDALDTPRLWSFVKKSRIFKNAERTKENANAFYALNLCLNEIMS
jgi:hypothetical protein